VLSAFELGIDISTIAKIVSLPEDAVLDILKKHGVV
jgi:hypothetical protein